MCFRVVLWHVVEAGGYWDLFAGPFSGREKAKSGRSVCDPPRVREEKAPWFDRREATDARRPSPPGCLGRSVCLG